MSTERTELVKLFKDFTRERYHPNAGEQGPALTEILVQLQGRGADMARWSMDDWEHVLAAEFGIDADHMPDYLEEIATWGAVDDAFWEEP